MGSGEETGSDLGSDAEKGLGSGAGSATGVEQDELVSKLYLVPWGLAKLLPPVYSSHGAQHFRRRVLPVVAR